MRLPRAHSPTEPVRTVTGTRNEVGGGRNQTAGSLWENQVILLRPLCGPCGAGCRGPALWLTSRWIETYNKICLSFLLYRSDVVWEGCEIAPLTTGDNLKKYKRIRIMGLGNAWRGGRVAGPFHRNPLLEGILQVVNVAEAPITKETILGFSPPEKPRLSLENILGSVNWKLRFVQTFQQAQPHCASSPSERSSAKPGTPTATPGRSSSGNRKS